MAKIQLFENFPLLKSSKARFIILNISFKIQLYRPNKHSYDTLVTTSSLQCNILVNFCWKACLCQSFSASHIDQPDISAFHRPLYKRPDCELTNGALSHGGRLLCILLPEARASFFQWCWCECEMASCYFIIGKVMYLALNFLLLEQFFGYILTGLYTSIFKRNYCDNFI
jgi:hypothetical protein